MNLQEITNNIRSYLNRMDDPELTNETIRDWLKIVNGQLNRDLWDHARMLRRSYLTVPAACQFVPLPNDLIQLKTLTCEGKNYLSWPQSIRESIKKNTHHYIDRGQTIEIHPTSELDREFIMDYYGTIADLVNPTDLNWVSYMAPDVYLYGGLKEAAVWTQNHAALQLWQAEFDKRLDSLRRQGYDQNLGSVPVIRYA